MNIGGIQQQQSLPPPSPAHPEQAVHVVVNGQHGVYVPFVFAAEWVDGPLSHWNVDKELIEELLETRDPYLATPPGARDWMEVWTEIESSAFYIDPQFRTWRLLHSGDLFAYCEGCEDDIEDMFY